MGSPPLTQDKFTTGVTLPLAAGITPAYAGQIIYIKQPFVLWWDHPRLRRTNNPLPIAAPASGGSPPLTQDKFFCVCRNGHATGITPAYAGQIPCLLPW